MQYGQRLKRIDVFISRHGIIAFMEHFRSAVDPRVDTFLIDPALSNPRAIHVYQKAGFEKVCEYIQSEGFFAGVEGVLMVKR